MRPLSLNSTGTQADGKATGQFEMTSGIPDPLQPSRKRIVYAIQFNFGGMQDRFVIIWPINPPEKPCARLLDSRNSWMTASKGDFVMTTVDQEKWKKDVIASVTLYRVSPVEFNGEIVESARDWIDAG